MPGNPKECRRHALTCMQLAQTAPYPEARQPFADLPNVAEAGRRHKSGQALVDLLSDFDEPERRAG